MFRQNVVVIALSHQMSLSKMFHAWFYNLCCFVVLAYLFYALAVEWSWKRLLQSFFGLVSIFKPFVGGWLCSVSFALFSIRYSSFYKIFRFRKAQQFIALACNRCHKVLRQSPHKYSAFYQPPIIKVLFLYRLIF